MYIQLIIKLSMRTVLLFVLLSQGYVKASDDLSNDPDHWMKTWTYIADEYKKPQSVSFIYYPTGRNAPPMGHAELEVNGSSWTLLGDTTYGKRPLNKLIAKAGDTGMPFFRYIFDVNFDQIKEVKKHIYKNKWAISCSQAALYPLEKAEICWVPFPLNVSPLLTAAYLKSGKELHLNNVKQIEYYGNPSLIKSILKMLPGIAIESVILSLPIMIKVLAEDQPQSNDTLAIE